MLKRLHVLQGAVGFGFASLWLKKWYEVFKPITKGKEQSLQLHNSSWQSFEQSAFIKFYFDDFMYNLNKCSAFIRGIFVFQDILFSIALMFG